MHGVPTIAPLTVITGHYGVGKTNLAINLALDAVASSPTVTLIDLDVVNPYFRSSDYAAMLEARGVHVVSPRFAGTTLDVPSLSPAVSGALERAGVVIVDAGGDDVGATALGRFSRQIQATDFAMLYVINRYRNLTTTPTEAALLLAEIETASHLRATAVVNNSHLKDETTMATILDALPFARETAALLGLPLAFSTVPASLEGTFSADPDAATYVENAYPIQTHVHTPWEESAVGTEEAW
jgi:hypothetical protein